MSNETELGAVISQTDDDRLARILDDYLAAVERGSSVTPEAILARFPADAEKLRGYLSGLQLFHAAIGSQRSVTASPLVGLPGEAQSIGDYRIIREIGRGGMGVVYEAWQISLHRRIALKILPFTVSHDAKQLSRFKNEAQAAAQVQHPNIVPVYTVGEDSGVHYYAMQLIEGQSLTSLLEALRSGHHSHDGTTAPNHTLTIVDSGPDSPRPLLRPEADSHPVQLNAAETADHIRAITRLGVQAAEALHAAHDYGVVHRDIKPSNLLLDDQGKLWITDFGLARCRENAGLTQTGDILGTMRYMSPEQARGCTALIDHRTDVYSLGVTLYELSTLHHPSDGNGELTLIFEREHRAPKPLRDWNRHIPIDFQTIVLKALAESPHDRYGSAQELADDLGRFLAGKPILASPPSVLTRTHKWLRRHRHMVLVAAALLIVASTAMTLVLAHERATAVRANTELRQSARQTYAAIDRLAQLGDQLAPIPGAEGVRHQLFDDLLNLYQQVQEQAIDDPSLATDRALAYSKSASLFEKLNDKQRAVESHQTAIKIWQERVTRHPQNAEYARNLALCQNNLGFLLAEMGQLDQSLALLKQAIQSQTQLRLVESDSLHMATDLATTYSNLGLVYSHSGDKPEAVENFEAAIGILAPLLDASATDQNALRTLAASYNNLGSLQDADHAANAATTYEKAIAIQLQLVKSHPNNRIHQADLARTYNNLGFLASRGKDWRKAEVCYADAIALQENLVTYSPLAGAYRRDLAISYNNLGMVQSRHGRLSDAAASFQKCVQLQKKLLAVQPRDVQLLSNQGSVFNNLGLLFDKQRRYAEAEEAYHWAISYQRKALHESPTSDRIRSLFGRHYTNLAANLTTQSKQDEATLVTLERQKLLSSQTIQTQISDDELAAAATRPTN